MAVTDYASLQTAINSWYNRTDVSTLVDYFIQIGENKIYRDIFTLNQGKGITQIETSLSSTIATGVIAVPSDLLAIKTLYVVSSGNSYLLERKTTEFIYSTFPSRTADNLPGYFAQEGTNFIFGPYPDSAYTISGTYWQKAAGLSGSNTTTWMTSNIPDILLAACNVAVAMQVQDPDNLQVWTSLYNDQMGAFITAEKAKAYSGSSLAISPS